MNQKQYIEVTENYLYVNYGFIDSNNESNMVFENNYYQYKLLLDYLMEMNQCNELKVVFIIDRNTTYHIHIYSFFISQKVQVAIRNTVNKNDSDKQAIQSGLSQDRTIRQLKLLEEIIERERYRFEDLVRKKSPKFMLQLIVDSIKEHKNKRDNLRRMLTNI